VYLEGLFLATILTALVIGTTATYAKADTYRAGEFTITLVVDIHNGCD
jgi:hypothetical protein